MKPKRVQLKRTKGWRMPENAVKVDRSTRWGNPFLIIKLPQSKWFPLDGWKRCWEVRHVENEPYGKPFDDESNAREFSLIRFSCEVAPLLDLQDLRGKNLACWCPLDQPCHADVLLDLANE